MLNERNEDPLLDFADENDATSFFSFFNYTFSMIKKRIINIYFSLHSLEALFLFEACWVAFSNT